MKHQSLWRERVRTFVLSCLLIFSAVSYSFGYTVSDFSAECRKGQVFITWKTPNIKNLQYNIYRSLVPLVSSAQLTSDVYLGFVRDSSSKNIQWSQCSKSKVFFKIKDDGEPLASSKGLYVVTCTDDLPYYYVVTVTNLSNDKEDKTVLPGTNSTLLPVTEKVAEPEPVFQDSIVAANGEVKALYTQFVNNQETKKYPAMCSTGSYGFNFFVIKRGNASKYSLFLLFNSYNDAPDKSVSVDDSFDNCYLLGVFDWLPIPNSDGSIGNNTYWCGYHEDFNFYSSSNPVPAKGTVKAYTQKRIWESVQWLESEVPIDTTRIYARGTSANGFGAVLTANNHSESIAAVYSVVEPTHISPADDLTKQMWGAGSSKLETDVQRWDTGDNLPFSDFMNEATMVHINDERSMPAMYDVHGKKDVTVIWDDSKIKWMDSLETNHLGGTWYWDQRDHTGSGKDFVDGETQPDFYRFATTISYPAFSNCSIDQNPGNGTPSNGDKYGALNGYLDWKDNISDKSCTYIIHLFVKDFYVGGALDPEQYSTCKTDITFRRLQKFKPSSGDVIKWYNYDDVTDEQLESGTINYKGGLITIKGVTVKKKGTRIKLKIQNCSSRMEEEEVNDQPVNSSAPVSFSKSPNGYTAHFNLQDNDQVVVEVFDLMGRKIVEKHSEFSSGENSTEIKTPGNGIFVVRLSSASFNYSEKLFFGN